MSTQLRLKAYCASTVFSLKIYFFGMKEFWTKKNCCLNLSQDNRCWLTFTRMNACSSFEHVGRPSKRIYCWKRCMSAHVSFLQVSFLNWALWIFQMRKSLKPEGRSPWRSLNRSLSCKYFTLCRNHHREVHTGEGHSRRAFRHWLL